MQMQNGFLHENAHFKWLQKNGHVKQNQDMNNCKILYALDFDKVLQSFSFRCVKCF